MPYRVQVILAEMHQWLPQNFVANLTKATAAQKCTPTVFEFLDDETYLLDRRPLPCWGGRGKGERRGGKKKEEEGASEREGKSVGREIKGPARRKTEWAQAGSGTDRHSMVQPWQRQHRPVAAPKQV